MSSKRLKVLLIVEHCNPEWASTPLIGYNFFKAISQLVDATLVTHERNREVLEKIKPSENIIYISESNFTKKYYRLIESISSIIPKEALRRPLDVVISYPIFAEFINQVCDKFRGQIEAGDYDIVHVITPVHTRYPIKIFKACKHTPFILGPVNGGVPFPEWFEEVAIKKYLDISFLIEFVRLITPGYKETYQQAGKILVGSAFTLNKLKNILKIPEDKFELLAENGISEVSVNEGKKIRSKNGHFNLLFVGRLVAFKCADILIEAVSRLKGAIKSKVIVTIVGDGSERSKLEKRVQDLDLGNIVKFVGWVLPEQTINYYNQADIFCFPSVRESGGAVALEAMACGLPCIVANNGGLSEYLTEETGFKIEPLSREYLTQELTNKIEIMLENEQLRESMSAKAIERAKEFTWESKARRIVKIYRENIERNSFESKTDNLV
ncbi:MAG TPA: glycosyltransferase family 1 protein [Cyanobacteria bacterium UBA11369]|nr:glycosyltransferase family 1 protein [Cyanobacteria bacterium UBA11371]HBE36958.1 glycosyltransferase family 1 protein [Cyanobacteria bacterium UBA11368]HBE53952.1 glycosyltransferase family 1 protein [Cyanobacteria bacterium UBA11369]